MSNLDHQAAQTKWETKQANKKARKMAKKLREKEIRNGKEKQN